MTRRNGEKEIRYADVRNDKPPPPFSSPVEGEETSGTNHPPLYPLPSREGNGMCSDPSREGNGDLCSPLKKDGCWYSSLQKESGFWYEIASRLPRTYT
ncbi:hypothetical protein ES705_25463 [subsurface metagenome]